MHSSASSMMAAFAMVEHKAAERELPAVAGWRKSWIFAGSEDGASQCHQTISL
jgi:hypothetical protein